MPVVASTHTAQQPRCYSLWPAAVAADAAAASAANWRQTAAAAAESCAAAAPPAAPPADEWWPFRAAGARADRKSGGGLDAPTMPKAAYFGTQHADGGLHDFVLLLHDGRNQLLLHHQRLLLNLLLQLVTNFSANDGTNYEWLVTCCCANAESACKR